MLTGLTNAGRQEPAEIVPPCRLAFIYHGKSKHIENSTMRASLPFLIMQMPAINVPGRQARERGDGSLGNFLEAFFLPLLIQRLVNVLPVVLSTLSLLLRRSNTKGTLTASRNLKARGMQPYLKRCQSDDGPGYLEKLPVAEILNSLDLKVLTVVNPGIQDYRSTSAKYYRNNEILQ